VEVLVVGSDTAVGSALLAAFAQWGRHEAMPLTLAAARWRSERQAKKAARKGGPQAIVDLRITALLASGFDLREIDLERAHWLAKACERSGIRYLLLSSDRVFSGAGGRSLREEDEPDATDAVGSGLAEIERRVVQAAPSALVLRIGPLFAARPHNLLSITCRNMGEASQAVFDDRAVFCPVANLDAARVVSAILDQLSAGAMASGFYHYCSTDRTTAYGFAEAVLAAASQYADCGDIAIRPTEDGGEGSTQHVLDCSRLRDAFAIKQVPWRGFINTLVRQYIEGHSAGLQRV
jgi:dTDP-4-dehydrorhamnose reductase